MKSEHLTLLFLKGQVTDWYPADQNPPARVVSIGRSADYKGPETTQLPKDVKIAYYNPPYYIEKYAPDPIGSKCAGANEERIECASCTGFTSDYDISTCLKPTPPPNARACNALGQQCQTGCVCKQGYLRISASRISECIPAQDCASGIGSCPLHLIQIAPFEILH